MDRLFGFMYPANAAAVTPNDGADLPRSGRLYVGGAGTVKVDTVGGDTVTYTVPAGAELTVLVKKVYSTGTTATNMVVSYPRYQ